MERRARAALVTAAVIFAIAVPALQAVLDLGLSAAAFSDRGDATLRAAGYAFSVWSVIYAGLIGYAARQWIGDSLVLRRTAAPAALAVAGCGAWIIAAALDARWASVIIIVASAAAAAGALRRVRAVAPGRADRWLVLAPLALLAGWLTVAAALNVLTVLTAEGLIGPGAAPGWAIGGVAAATAAGLTLIPVTRRPLAAAPVAWGLVAVYVAEKADQTPVALVALAGAALLALAAVATFIKRRP